MKKTSKTVMAAVMKGLTAALACGLLSLTLSLTALADSKGTVTVNDAKVRADASTDAQTLTKVNSGTEVTVTDEKTDSSGNIWYHVTLSDGTTGYIRSDLMTVTASTDSGDAAAADSFDTSGEDLAGSEASGGNIVNGVDISGISLPDGVEAQDYQNGTINVDSGKVRADASTNDEIVSTLANGTQIVVAGSKLGSDSKTWYYVAFSDNGAQKTGFVRSDLVNLGEVIVVSTAEETEPAESMEFAEETEEVPEVNNDYELVYTDDGTGNNVWYLYNHIDNTREKLQELLDFADSQASKSAEYTSAIQKYKIISIVLGVLLAISVIALVIMIIKLVSSGYEYEDEDEEEEEEPPVETRRDRRRRARAYEEEDEDEDDDDSDVKIVKEAPRASAAPKSKPKNFMLDDDDFEFLNIDDK